MSRENTSYEDRESYQWLLSVMQSLELIEHRKGEMFKRYVWSGSIFRWWNNE